MSSPTTLPSAAAADHLVSDTDDDLSVCGLDVSAEPWIDDFYTSPNRCGACAVLDAIGVQAPRRNPGEEHDGAI